MIILSLNVRDLGIPAKISSLDILLEVNKPIIILLQEFVGKGNKTLESPSKFLKGWDFLDLNANGIYGELVTI